MPSNRPVPVDPALPALQSLFQDGGPSQFVADTLAEVARNAVVRDAIELSYIRYRPGKSCVVGWSWLDHAGVQRLASGRIFHNDRAEKLLAKESSRLAIEGAARISGARDAYRYVSDRQLLFQVFPFDLQLTNLAKASAPAWVAGALDADDGSVIVTPISYKPWRRCVLRYDLQGVGSSYFAKVFRDDRGADLLRWHQIVSGALAEGNAPWSIPQVHAYLPEARTLIFDALKGAQKVRRLLRPALADAAARRQLLDHVEAAANGLPLLQAAQFENLPSETPDEVIHNFRRDAEGISAVAPALDRLVADALDRLESVAQTLEPEPLVPTHGAFRHDQLLYTDNQLFVLDLDTICRSGASADAGNFLGYLDLTAIRRPRLRSVIDACTDTFIQAVQANRHTNWQWRIWYRAAAHIKKALRAFFALEPGWPATSETLLHLAVRTLLQLATHTTPVRDNDLPQVATGADHKAVRRLIAERAVPTLFPGHTLARMRVRYSRYKPGREHVTLYGIDIDPPSGEPLFLTATFARSNRIQKIRSRSEDIAGVARSALFLHEEGCAFQVFPLDAGLPLLWRAAHPSRVPDLLASFMPDMTNVHVNELSVLRYRPARRCVIRYGISHTNGTLDAVAKLYASTENAVSAGAKHRALSKQTGGAFRVPDVLADTGQLPLLLMELLPGDSFGELLEHATSGSTADSMVRSAARALATFHSLSYTGPEGRSARAELGNVKGRLSALRQAMPNLATEVEELIEEADQALGQMAPGETCVVHGEYKPNQILWSDGLVGVVDLDRVCLGDPAVDVGNFAAVLRKETTLEGHAHLSEGASSFIEEYLAARPSEGLAKRAHLFEVIALLRMLARSFERSPHLAVQEGDAWQPRVLIHQSRTLLKSL